MSHPLRFGILTLQDRPYATLLEHWRQIEALGYDSIWVADHFTNPHQIDDDWFDGWTLLAALAAHTSRIRIGPLVTNIIYRNPAVLARQALTLDHISQGRLTLGVGATSARDPSHRMTGVEIWSVSERLRRFREVVEIVDQMLRTATTTYPGRHYPIADARMHPAPIQMPRPPLTIAAATPASLKVAARYADTWNTYGGFNLSPQESLALTRQRGEQLDQACAAIGRDPAEITRSFLAGLTADTPFASLDAFHDFIGRLREIGISEFIFYYGYAALPLEKCLTRDMLERVALEAIPKLRAGE